MKNTFAPHAFKTFNFRPGTLAGTFAAAGDAVGQMVELSASTKPTYAVDGQSVAWSNHLSAMIDRIDLLVDRGAEAEQFESESVGVP